MQPTTDYPFTRCLFTVEAEDDPQLPSRILGLFTQRGHLPEGFSSRKSREGLLRVTVEISTLDDPICQLLARKMLNIPTVLDVSLSRLRQCAPSSGASRPLLPVGEGHG